MNLPRISEKLRENLVKNQTQIGRFCRYDLVARSNNSGFFRENPRRRGGLMAAIQARHQHRHFKTLIVLVLAMTGGTFLLFTIAQFSPVTPLRASAGPWNQIVVRTEGPQTDRGFFHYRIDDSGRLFQSYAWKAGQHDRSSPGAIHVLLTCTDHKMQVTGAQARTLSVILQQLQQQFAVSSDAISVDAGESLAEVTGSNSGSRRRT